MTPKDRGTFILKGAVLVDDFMVNIMSHELLWKAGYRINDDDGTNRCGSTHGGVILKLKRYFNQRVVDWENGDLDKVDAINAVKGAQARQRGQL